VKKVESVEDLAQLTLSISFRSTTHRDALELQASSGVKLNLADVSDGVEMEEMMERVARGEYEATIADSNLVDLARAMGVEVEPRFAIGKPHQKGWAVHPAAPALQAAADQFIAESRKNGLIRIFHARYYETRSKWVKKAHDDELRTDVAGRISPYDELFKKAGAETGLDWRLLAAVAYTESRFDPKAKSDWGAVGLMQVLPSTAKGLGVKEGLEDPAVNIMVGSRYLKRLVSIFEKEEITKRQRIRLAVAAYNAGIGHILDARALARQTGRDPNRWFQSVEQALLLKTDRKWHEKTKYGYCRAGETIGYVSAVQSRYDVYARHVPL
jgi:membrane-bound lytic murein transglycosylase F